MASKTFHEFQSFEKGQTLPSIYVQRQSGLSSEHRLQCSFTPQYRELERLYQQINDEHPNKFVVLGFPCNQFGNQDPGTDDEIQTFCQVNYGVSFPVLRKVDVNGPNADPLWSWMKQKQPGIFGLERIKWNFEKFLITADGQVAGRWWSMVKPQSLHDTIVRDIEAVRG
ncbi:hypothetical protein HFD88_007296 [Aspergillus terreus]|nr:hypothetical protein HFD88_007296 [Aspergillus terreus]